jgi:peptidoglycan/xylan/chitin deacetylase (PgdA/CDA1 family)
VPLIPIPILLYHSVSDDPSPRIRPITVRPETLATHVALVAELGCTSLTVGELVRSLTSSNGVLPERPVVITFDDGYADFYATALPALQEARLATSLYIATALLPGRHRPPDAPSPLGRMLSWSQLREVAAEGVEIGGHSHTHPHLDTLSASRSRNEIELCKRLLEDELQTGIETFAYPNGYSSKRVRLLTQEAGFLGACAVKNALSSNEDDVFALARLTIRSTTTAEELRGWLTGRSARIAPFRERPQTRLWRIARRTRAITTGKPGSDLTRE